MSGPRIQPLDYAEWDTEALSVLAPGRRLPPSNVLGLFARHPDLARAFLTFNAHLLGTSTLPPRTRELAILRIAWRRRCRYEWAQHVAIARRAGVTAEEIAQVRSGCYARAACRACAQRADAPCHGGAIIVSCDGHDPGTQAAGPR